MTRRVCLGRKLTKVLKNYVDNAEKLTEQLLKAMKALEYIFKFIVRSRVLFNQYVITRLSFHNDNDAGVYIKNAECEHDIYTKILLV